MNHRIDHLRARLRDDPGSRLFFQLGDLLRKAGELDEAEEILRGGLEEHPRYVAAWVSLGRIQLDEAEFSEAERSFAKALELDPENAVAARLIGETAEKAAEWVRAVKAYKLARALSPRDPDLDARIEAIERRLAGGPDDITPERVEEPSGDEAPEVAEIGVPGETATAPEPFAVEAPLPEHREPFGFTRPVSRSRVMISTSEADPFAVTSTGDTGVWMVADDVFAPPEPPFEPSVEDVFGGDQTDDVPTLPPQDGFEPVDEPALEAESEIEPVIAETIPEEPVVRPEAEPARELPLPTVTLARLALEQGDRPLAMEALQAVLERDPANREAGDLLERLDEDPNTEVSEPPSPEVSVTPVDLPVAKAEALKGWMENIRAAAERRAP